MRIRLYRRDEDDVDITSTTSSPDTAFQTFTNVPLEATFSSLLTSSDNFLPLLTTPTPTPTPSVSKFIYTDVNGVLHTLDSASTLPPTTVTVTTKKFPFSYPLPSVTAFPGNITVGSPDEQVFWDKFSEGTKAAIIISIIFGVVAIIIASIWFCCGKPKREKLKAQEAMQLHRERMDADARAADNEPLGSSVQDLGNSASVAATGERRGQVQMRDLSGQRNSIAPVAARGAVGRVASRVSRHMSLRGGGSVAGSDAPPRYEEVVPPAHQRLAGGIAQRGGEISPVDDDEGAGMVADGKTPLSEIPFEDVVLNHQTAGSSSSSSNAGEEGGRDFSTRHAAGGGDTSGHTNV